MIENKTSHLSNLMMEMWCVCVCVCIHGYVNPSFQFNMMICAESSHGKSSGFHWVKTGYMYILYIVYHVYLLLCIIYIYFCSVGCLSHCKNALSATTFQGVVVGSCCRICAMFPRFTLRFCSSAEISSVKPWFCCTRFPAAQSHMERI